MSHSPQLWSVKFSRKAEDQYEKLKRSGKKPSINDIINLLVIEMRKEGPYRSNWPNYGPLNDNEFHCHLKKGKPTYVACWKIVDKKNKIIEVIMSAHMRKHHIEEYPCEVILRMPGRKSIHSYIPENAVPKIEAVLNKYAEDSVDWAVLAKESISKYKQAGMVLRGARYREGLSQKALARRSGVSQENISHIENGRRRVGEKVAKKLAKHLKIDYRLLVEDYISETAK